MGKGKLDPARGSLDKWQMYIALEDEDIGAAKLPNTSLLSADTLQTMLETVSTVYVKPIHTWGGHQISRISPYANGRYIWERQGAPSMTYLTVQDLVQDVVSAYCELPAIVQEGAPLVHIQDAPFDIRVMMQRDEHDSWVHAGSLARVAGECAIVSNVGVSKGRVVPAEEAVSLALHRPTAELSAIMSQLPQVGHAICNVLESYRLFNEVGVDLGVDEAGQLWLLEVNTDDNLGGPSHDLFAQLPDTQTYLDIKRRSEARQQSLLIDLLGAFWAAE